MAEHRWDILPPEELLAAIEYLHILAYGSRRYEAYELSSGGTLPLSKRLYRKTDLVKNGDAFCDLVDLQRFLSKLGRRIQNGGDWREYINWDVVLPRKQKKAS
ncbi:MAG: hypothetical protein AB1384_12540 [Actinomycetota bacterium]